MRFSVTDGAVFTTARHQTLMETGDRLHTCMNLKVKYTVPMLCVTVSHVKSDTVILTYPNNQSDQVQIARECDIRDNNDDDDIANMDVITMMKDRGLWIGECQTPTGGEGTGFILCVYHIESVSIKKVCTSDWNGRLGINTQSGG